MTNSTCETESGNEHMGTFYIAIFKSSASAGSRTRVDCLEGNHANRYTTDATDLFCSLIRYRMYSSLYFWDVSQKYCQTIQFEDSRLLRCVKKIPGEGSPIVQPPIPGFGSLYHSQKERSEAHWEGVCPLAWLTATGSWSHVLRVVGTASQCISDSVRVFLHSKPAWTYLSTGIYTM